MEAIINENEQMVLSFLPRCHACGVPSDVHATSAHGLLPTCLFLCLPAPRAPLPRPTARLLPCWPPQIALLLFDLWENEEATHINRMNLNLWDNAGNSAMHHLAMEKNHAQNLDVPKIAKRMLSLCPMPLHKYVGAALPALATM